MIVNLVDGTYELFRHHFGRRPQVPQGATKGVLTMVMTMLEDGVTHVGVASDHVIESFRNDLWDGYKTSEGMPPELLEQIPLLEGALAAMGVMVWPMVEWEADDALASAAGVADADPRVERVVIHTPDKDLAQCVRDGRVVQLDVRNKVTVDEAGVVAKFGVLPGSITDYLALVGDSADGYPGVAGWGAKSTAAVLARYEHLEQIPPTAMSWDVPGVRNAAVLSKALNDYMHLAVLFRRLATLERDVPVGTVDDWCWRGPRQQFAHLCDELGIPALAVRAVRLAAARRG
jgi:5'-3' exonuclease